MMKYIVKYRKVLLLGWILLILVATLLPGSSFPKVPDWTNLFHPDKIVHLIIFSVLGYLLLLNINIKVKKQKFFIFFLIGILFAGGTEILQGVLPINRSMSIYDMIANIVGLFFGFLLWERMMRNKLDPNKKA